MKEVSSLSVKTNKARIKSVSQKIDKTPFYKDSSFIFPVIAFFITALLFIISCVLFNIAPFGSAHVLSSDLKAQYSPFLTLWKHHIKNLDFRHFLESISYSFYLGGGKNFFGTLAYYLSSPLNLILFLFNDESLYNGITILLMLKLSFASSFMCMFLRTRAENKKSAWPILLGVIYAFSSYTMIFMFNIMWMDGYCLLPLLLFFIEKYLDKNKYKGIVLTLVVLFVSQFYIAYMVGIFSFLYLLVRLYEKKAIENSLDIKTALKKVGKFILVAVVSALIASAVLVPAALDILGNSDVTSYSELNKSDVVTFSAISMPDQIFMGADGDFSSVLPDNLPYVFLSLLVTSSVAIYLASDFFKGRQKTVYLVCLIAVYIFFAVDVLDIFWQAFDHPNWFWHRYSFVFFPFMLTITLRVLENAKNVANKDIRKAYLVLLAVLIVAQSFGQMKSNGLIFVINLAFLSLLMLLYSFLKREVWPEAIKNMQKLSAFFICLIVVFETAFICPGLSSGIATLRNPSSADDYQKSAASLITFAEATKNSGDGERMELECIYSDKTYDRLCARESSEIAYYMSTSFFNTASNKPYHRFLKQLGYSVNYNYFNAEYCYASKPVDMFFAIDSVITEFDYAEGRFITNDFFDAGYKLYVYDDCLPLGFAVANSANDFDFYRLETDVGAKNYFDFQNDWYRSLFPSFTEDFYNTYDASALSIEYVNGETLDVSIYGIENHLNSLFVDSLGREGEADYSSNCNTLYRENGKIPMAIDISFTAEYSGEHYVNISVPNIMDDERLVMDGKIIQSADGNSPYSLIFRLGYFEEGETVNFSITTEKDFISFSSINVACFDGEGFDSMFAGVDKTAVSCSNLENGYVTFSTNISSNETVLTTIPYEKGWTLYIDGVESEIIPYQDALISFNPGTGTHNVELKFVAPGLKIGIVASACGILLLAAIGVYDITLGKNKKKDITANK